MSDSPSLPPSPKRPAWFKKLSPIVQATVDARVIADGYGNDLDAWVADLLTTARRLPQGMLLRLSLSESDARGKPESENLELPLGGGQA